ncbi:MAG: S9 family peptidase [Lishizhenia sp.]
MNSKYPVAQKQKKLLNHLNDTRVDNYFWMNQRDSKEVLSYIKEENNYTKEYFKRLESIQTNLLNEFDSKIDPNEKGAPFFIQGKKYQSENIAGKDYRVTSVFKEEGTKTVFIDQNERAKEHSFYALASWELSPNNEITALAEDFIGRRKYQITFRNNADNTFFDDKIIDVDGSVVWSNDNKTVYYVKKDPVTLREFQVYKHTLGTDVSLDELVFEELNEEYYVSIHKGSANKFIQINLFSSTTSETWLINANDPKSKPFVFIEREKDHLYEVSAHTTGFFVLTNKNAINNKVVFIKSLENKLEDGEVVVSHDASNLIEEIYVFKNYVVSKERKNGLNTFRVINWTNKTETFIHFDEETYSVSNGVNTAFDTADYYFSYTSLTTPTTVLKYNLTTNRKEIFFEKKLIDPNFTSKNYISERVWATATDGEKIPISLVYKKGTELQKAPLLLYGYGSYGITIPTYFSPTRLSLLDRGFVFAIAHIRGGKYMGEEWYQNGKFLNKKNTFTDFIACAQFLSENGYANANKIYAQGGSAGGLLTGAVINLSPQTFKGIIAQVPFVDVVTTMLDETLPLTVGEYQEWGNPNDKKYYDYMKSYSPYDNVQPQDYPSIYISTGYHDSQVQYFEPLKWVAKLRENKTDDNILLFDCNMDAGHGGGSGRTTERIEIAKSYAFLLSLEHFEK